MQTKIKGISRIDSKHTHGWFVRISREGKIHSKMFSDRPHGGKEEALQAAIRYRDQYEKDHPRKMERLRIRQTLPRNNSTGILGVYETYEPRSGGRKRPCFCVTWSPAPNRVQIKKFCIDHFEDRESALKAAIDFRKAREQEIIAECRRQEELAKEMKPNEAMLAALKSRPLPTRLPKRNGASQQ